jgi:hypothetical protein
LYYMTNEQGKISKIRRPKKVFQVILLSTVIIFIGAGFTLLGQIYQHTFVGAIPADDVSVVGPPSLPAQMVDTIFARIGSPMVGTGRAVEQASRQAGVDDAFALGVWWTETNDGAAGVGRADLNPGSVRGGQGYPVAFDGYTIYPSYAAAISDWFKLLKNSYVNRGLSTVYTIAYPYVGTSSAPLWAGKVIALMEQYRGEVPPATPTPTVRPTRSASVKQKVKQVVNDEVPPPVSSQQQTTQGSQTPTITRVAHAAQTTDQPTMSRAIEVGMLGFAFLGVGAIVCWGLWLRRRRSIEALAPYTFGNAAAAATASQSSEREEVFIVPTVSPGEELLLATTPAPVFNGDELSPIIEEAAVAPTNGGQRNERSSQGFAPIPITSAFNLPIHDVRTNQPIRRITLVPSRTETGGIPAASEARSTGLLSRYRDGQF